jgi:predicted ATPase/class 3 adenylate cyclase
MNARARLAAMIGQGAGPSRGENASPGHPWQEDLPSICQVDHTFLFTDIEASTLLWEERPEEMAAALERHDSMLGSAIVDCGGAVLKTTGDGVIAVFDSPVDAVAASLEMQRALAASDWEGIGQLRVRMGVHTGEAQSRAGDYFGPTLNRTARIMAAGHGGQILLSRATAAATNGRLPDGASLRDLGSHRLKDLSDPEHLFQLAHGDIASEFADLVTLDARPNNLPRQTTEFLGRVDELAAIQLMLESPGTRLLTLFGPGGAGKTRLALQVAAEQIDRFRDGVFFVDLSAEGDTRAAFELVVRTLDLPVSGEGDPLEVLKMRLRDRQMLLVLDNFEQLMPAAAGVSELLQTCPELQILVTSRETLRVRAERVFPVPSLSMPDPRDPLEQLAESEAVQLFLDRARAVRPDFTLDEDTGPMVAEICLRLDGLPLAIELAAARLNVFTPADLLSRLRVRLDVLGAGGRDLPERQRTLWGAIGWSYELLDDEERELLKMLSVFSTARIAAVEAVAVSALGIQMALDPLSGLVEKSLVRGDTSGESTKFSMLLMVKEYAQTKLEESVVREQAVRKAHATYYSEFALGLQDRLRGVGRDSALVDLGAEIGNVRTAWRYWVDQGDLEQLFGLLDVLWALHEARGWYHAAIELAKDTLGVLTTAESSPELAAEELVLRSSLARALMAVRGYDVEVEEAFKVALELSQASAIPEQQFPVLRALASYYILSGNLPEAASIGGQILELGEDLNDEAMRIEGHSVIGTAITFGDVSISLSHLEQAIEGYDPTRHGSNRFRLGSNTGVTVRIASALTLWLCGDVVRAVSRAADALSLARQLEHPFSIAYALHHNAYFAVLRGRFEECLAFTEELDEIAGENDYAIWETLSTVLEGVALSGLGQTEEGLAKTEVGIDLYQGLTTPPVFWPFLLGLRATVHARADLPVAALELIDEAIGIGQIGGAPLPWLGMDKADAMRLLPDPDLDQVARLYEETMETAQTLRLTMVELQAATRLVAMRRELGVVPDGSDRLATVYSTFTSGHDERDLIAASELLGGATPQHREG